MRVAFGDLLLLEFRQHQLGRFGHGRAAEGQLDGRDIDAGEQRVEIGRRELLPGDREAQRIDARIEQLQRLGIRLLRTFHFDGLVYAPAVVLARAPDIRKLPCLGAHETDAFEALGPVVGTDVETFARTPHQLALVIGSFQVGRNHLLPLLGRDGGELAKQLFTIGICHNYLEISNRVFDTACKDNKLSAIHRGNC